MASRSSGNSRSSWLVFSSIARSDANSFVVKIATLTAFPPNRPARPTRCAYVAASGGTSMCTTRLTRSRSTPRLVRSVDTNTRNSKSRIFRIASNRSVCGVAPETNPARTPLRSISRASASPRAGLLTNTIHWWNATRANRESRALSLPSLTSSRFSSRERRVIKNCRTASKPFVACVHSSTRAAFLVIASTRATVSGGYVAENASVCSVCGDDTVSSREVVRAPSERRLEPPASSEEARSMARRNSTSASNEPRVSASASSSTKRRTSSARREPSSRS